MAKYENTQKYNNTIKHKTSKKRFSNIKIMAFTLLVFFFIIIYYVNVDILDYFNLSRSADFITNGCGNGTLLDAISGLCWQQDLGTGGQKTWSNASSYCSALSLGGHSDWRLPIRNELFTLDNFTLIDQILSPGATCTTLVSFGFTNCHNTFYWSATTYDPNSSYAGYVLFDYGDDPTYSKSHKHYVACVRRN